MVVPGLFVVDLLGGILWGEWIWGTCCLSWCGDVGWQDGVDVRFGEVPIGSLRIWCGSRVARIVLRAAVHELVEDEDVDSARDLVDEPGHRVELLQREILSERAGCVVSAAIPYGGAVCREVGCRWGVMY